MQIHGTSQVHGAQNINAPHAAQRAAQSSAANRSASLGDQLDISRAAQLASQLGDVPEIRQDRVAALRAAIASGTYETEDRLSGALDRLLDEIG